MNYYNSIADMHNETKFKKEYAEYPTLDNFVSDKVAGQKETMKKCVPQFDSHNKETDRLVKYFETHDLIKQGKIDRINALPVGSRPEEVL